MPQASERRNFGRAGVAKTAASSGPEQSHLSEREENLRLLGEVMVGLGLLALLSVLFLLQQFDPGLAYNGYIHLPEGVKELNPRLAALVDTVSFVDRFGMPFGFGFFGMGLLFLAFGALARRRRLMTVLLLVISFTPYGLFGLYVPYVTAAGWLIVVWSIVASFRRSRRMEGALWLLFFVIVWNVYDLPALSPEAFPPNHDAIAFARMVPPAQSPIAGPLTPVPYSAVPTFAPPGTLSTTPEQASVAKEPLFESFRGLGRQGSAEMAYVLVQEGYYRRDLGMIEANLKRAWDGREPDDEVARRRLVAAALLVADKGLDDAGLAPPERKRLGIISLIALPMTFLAIGLLAFGYALQILAGLLAARLERLKTIDPVRAAAMAAPTPSASPADEAADWDGGFAAIRQLHRRARTMARMALLLAGFAFLLAGGGWFFHPGASAAWPAFDRLHLMPAVLNIIPDGVDVTETIRPAFPVAGFAGILFWVAIGVAFVRFLALRRYRPALAMLAGVIGFYAFSLIIPVKRGAIEMPLAGLPSVMRDALAARRQAGLPVKGDKEGEAYAYLDAQIAYLENDPARTWTHLQGLDGTSYQMNASVAWRLAVMREWLIDRGVQEAASMTPDFSLDNRRLMAWWLVAAALLLAGLALLSALFWYLLRRRFRQLSALLESLAGSGLARRTGRYGRGGPSPA